MAERVVVLQDWAQEHPLNYEKALTRIREILVTGAVFLEVVAEKVLGDKNLQIIDVAYVIRAGNIIGHRRVGDTWAYTLRKLSVDKQYLSCDVVIYGNFIIIAEVY